MRRNLGRTWLLCGVLALAGCGGDGNGGGDGGVSDGGGMTDTGMNGGGGGDAGGVVCSDMEQTTLQDTCFQNTGMDGMNRDIIRLANYCGRMECINMLIQLSGGGASEMQKDMARQCVNNCMQDNTDNLKSGCTNCFARAAVCVGENCTNMCAQNAEAKECLQCQCDNGCQQIGADCSGVPSPVCPVQDCSSDSDCTEPNKGVCHPDQGYCQRMSPCSSG